MVSMRLLVIGLVLVTASGGCTHFGADRLYQDQLGYTEALADSQKSQALLNVVRLRYAEAPVFLNTTQVISGYTLQQSLTGTLAWFPSQSSSSSVAGTPGVTFTQNPTFTFQPVTGQALAESFIRPLTPAELLPLTLSGLPIDVLFRLATQSVNGLSNRALLDAHSRTASAGFARLLVNLRQLQIAGVLNVHLDPGQEAKDPKAKLAGRLVLTISNGLDADTRAIAVDTRRMLGLADDATEAEVVYGRDATGPGQIAILTRSVLGILGQVAAEVEVPPEDVTDGLTHDPGLDQAILKRPTVIVRTTRAPPHDPYASVRYRNRWYWIASNDFDSKLAFSVLQILMTLAETAQPAGTVVTIPSR